MRGHAIEARVYAEDPARGFLPTGGAVLALREPAGPGHRVDSALADGHDRDSDYDPMLAKVIAWGADRATALRRLDAALAGTVVLGVTTNVAFLRGAARRPRRAGRPPRHRPGRARLRPRRLECGERKRRGDRGRGNRGRRSGGRRDHARARRGGSRPAAHQGAARAGDRPVGHPRRLAFRRPVLDEAPAVARTGEPPPRSGCAALPRPAPRSRSATANRKRPARQFRAAPGGGTDLVITAAGRTLRYAYAADGATAWLGRDGRTWAVREEQAALAAGGPGHGGRRHRPLPHAGHGPGGPRDRRRAVTAGQPVLVVEAMKMEHTVTAPVDGVVAELTAKPGQQVTMDETLAVIGPDSAEGGSLGALGCS